MSNKSPRVSWRDMIEAIMSGETATAYYAAGTHTMVDHVHIGRIELDGPSVSGIMHDVLFDVSPPNDDWIGTVTVSEVGKDFMDGMPFEELRAKHGLGDYDMKNLRTRRRMMDPDKAARQSAIRQQYVRNNRVSVGEARRKHRSSSHLRRSLANG